MKRSRCNSASGCPDAFDYGLLIGHEDFRLIRDETADIYVTFPHRSIQEFLGAFYFICELHRGYRIETILGETDHKLMSVETVLGTDESQTSYL